MQPLPNASDEVLDKLENNLKNINSVTDLVASGLDANEIISKVCAGLNIKFLKTTYLNFRCHCNRQRIEEVLMSLSKDDLQSLIDDGHAEVNCQFCGQKYQFSSEDLQNLKQQRDRN